jgi:hypothetical protein
MLLGITITDAYGFDAGREVSESGTGALVWSGKALVWEV